MGYLDFPSKLFNLTEWNNFFNEPFLIVEKYDSDNFFDYEGGRTEEGCSNATSRRKIGVSQDRKTS